MPTFFPNLCKKRFTLFGNLLCSIGINVIHHRHQQNNSRVNQYTTNVFCRRLHVNDQRAITRYIGLQIQEYIKQRCCLFTTYAVWAVFFYAIRIQ